MRNPIVQRPLLLIAISTLMTGTAVAQNPISSKVVGSDVALRNRQLRKVFSTERQTKGNSTSDTVQIFARLMALTSQSNASSKDTLDLLKGVSTVKLALMKREVDAFFTNTRDTLSTADAKSECAGVDGVLVLVGAADATAAAQLNRLCRAVELRSIVPEAIRLAIADARKSKIGGRLLQLTVEENASTSFSDGIATDALDRVLSAIESGHTNPQRWYLGGQIGLPILGQGNDAGLASKASVRASYFVPVSAFRSWQLPVVTNLGDVSGAPQQEQKDKLRAVNTSSAGAFLSIEPTFDPITPGRFKDWRLQPFLALGGQINSLRDLADTSDVLLSQTRIGGGINLEIGTAAEGRPALFLTTRALWRRFDASSAARVLNNSKRDQLLMETIGLIPVGGGTSILVEVSAAKRSAPTLRIGLWAQASPQSGKSK